MMGQLNYTGQDSERAVDAATSLEIYRGLNKKEKNMFLQDFFLEEKGKGGKNMKFMTTWTQQVTITNEANVSATQNWMSRQYTWNSSKDRAGGFVHHVYVDDPCAGVIFAQLDESYLLRRRIGL